MKRLLTIARILSGVNIVFWGFVSVGGVLSALHPLNTKMLGLAFIMTGIPLHSFATLKLGKSIKKPLLPLGSQTPIGVRLMGALTLFIGFMMITQGITFLQHFNETVAFATELKAETSNEAIKNLSSLQIARSLVIISIFPGLFCTANAVISFQLLRSFLLAKDRERQERQDSQK